MTKVISTTSTNTNKTRTLEKENEKYIFMIALSLIYAMILAATFWIPLDKSMTFIQIFSSFPRYYKVSQKKLGVTTCNSSSNSQFFLGHLVVSPQLTPSLFKSYGEN